MKLPKYDGWKVAVPVLRHRHTALGEGLVELFASGFLHLSPGIGLGTFSLNQLYFCSGAFLLLVATWQSAVCVAPLQFPPCHKFA